jgi:hypothetical protein
MSMDQLAAIEARIREAWPMMSPAQRQNATAKLAAARAALQQRQQIEKDQPSALAQTASGIAGTAGTVAGTYLMSQMMGGGAAAAGAGAGASAAGAGAAGAGAGAAGAGAGAAGAGAAGTGASTMGATFAAAAPPVAAALLAAYELNRQHKEWGKSNQGSLKKGLKGLVTGGLSGFAEGVITRGKHKDQLLRDGVRRGLQQGGILGDDYKIQLGNGKVIDMSKDGGPRAEFGGRRAYEIDLNNKDNGALIGKLQGLGDYAAFKSGGKSKQGEDTTGYFVNSLQGGSDNDIKSLYGKFGITNRDQGYNAINEMQNAGFIDSGRGDAMRNALNGLFGAGGGGSNQGSPGMRPGQKRYGGPDLQGKDRADYNNFMHDLKKGAGGDKGLIRDGQSAYIESIRAGEGSGKGRGAAPKLKGTVSSNPLILPAQANDSGRIANQSRVGIAQPMPTPRNPLLLTDEQKRKFQFY